MATTFDDNERSASQNRPIDLYTITTPTHTYYLTSYSTDVSFNGQVFTAITMSRGERELAQDLTGRELTITLPITHELVQRYAATGVPERQVFVTLQRLQEKSGQAIREGGGFAQSMAMDGPHMAVFRIPAITDDAMKIRLPTVTASRTCPHTLFDAGCAPTVFVDGHNVIDGPIRDNFFIATTVVSQVGGTLTVFAMGAVPDQWAQFGEVVHLSTGERRLVLAQTGAVLTINVPFVGLAVGDGVQVFAGCDHSLISHCRLKFNNVRNFGGQAYLSVNLNPWTPAGLGVIVQP